MPHLNICLIWHGARHLEFSQCWLEKGECFQQSLRFFQQENWMVNGLSLPVMSLVQRGEDEVGVLLRL